MGLFSDKCPKCGTRVKKRSRYCPSCGQAAPGGWRHCANCGKWVGIESEHCWNCGHAIPTRAQVSLDTGRWQRAGDVAAQRLEVDDIRGRLAKTLVIEQGTAALFLSGGRYKGVLEPGEHTVDGVLHKINHFFDPPPRTVFLVEAGEFELNLLLGHLVAGDKFPVDLMLRLVLQLDLKRGESFLTNFVKESVEVSYDDIAERLTAEVRQAADLFTKGRRPEDLVADPAVRPALETELREALKPLLESTGIRLIRLAVIDYGGEAYNALRERLSEVETSRRNLELDQKLRELGASDRMHQFKTEHELEEYAAELAHEKGIRIEERGHTLGLLKQAHRHELDVRELDHALARAEKTRKGELDALFDREKAQIEITKWWLEVRRAKEAQARESRAADLKVDRDHERERAEYLGKATFEALLAVTGDAALRADLLRLKGMQMAGEQGVEQQLAMALQQNNPDAARVLQEYYQSRGGAEAKEEIKELLQQQLKESRATYEELVRSMAKAFQGPGTVIHERGRDR